MSSPHALPGILPPFLGGYAGKHAAPSTLAPGARTALAAGLAVAVLPLAAPAAAAEETTAPSVSLSQDAAPVVPVEAADPATATVTPEAPAAEEPQAAEPVVETGPAESLVRLSAPARDSDGRVPVSVRLLADGSPVRNGAVRLERSTGKGWSYAGRLLTNASGLGAGTLSVPATSALRAVYVGSEVRTPAESAARRVVVDLVKPGSTGAGLALRGATVLSQARSQVGKPYVFGATGPSAFDCSGFTRWVYAKVGKSLPHNSAAQERVTARVSKAEAKPGDLIFLKGVRGHVGIYAGNGRMYDAPRAGKDVTLRRIWTSNYVVGRVK